MATLFNKQTSGVYTKLKCSCSKGKTKHYVIDGLKLQCNNCGEKEKYSIDPTKNQKLIME